MRHSTLRPTWIGLAAGMALVVGTGRVSAQCPGVDPCFVEHLSTGCDDEECCQAVCAIDSWCCSDSWDELCAQEAIDLCGGFPGACCLPDGTCVEASLVECTALGGGPFVSPGADCADVHCPLIGCEVGKWLAADAASGDNYGYAVSVNGDVALVGVSADDDDGTNSGSAYVFRREGSLWHEEQKLTASDGTAWDSFGYSVAVSGDVAIIGAYRDDHNGTYAGSAYVFRWSGTSWIEEQKLLASDSAEWDKFGDAVSVSGDVAVVGAPDDNDNAPGSGSVYVFRWNGAQWLEEQKLHASDAWLGANLGDAVAVSGDVTIAGSRGNPGASTSAAYVFRWNGAQWLEEHKLLAADGTDGDGFGISVALSGDWAIVGAFADDDNGSGAGAAHLFNWDGAEWSAGQKIIASEGATADHFGIAVSVSDDVAVVGAEGDRDYGSSTGSAYAFRWNGAGWIEEQKLRALDGAAGDRFGRAVAVSGDVAIVGALDDEDNGISSGSAYVVDLTGDACACPADLDGTGTVDVTDLLMILAGWGTPGADVTGDGTTDVADLLALLASFGPCPT